MHVSRKTWTTTGMRKKVIFFINWVYPPYALIRPIVFLKACRILRIAITNRAASVAERMGPVGLFWSV